MLRTCLFACLSACLAPLLLSACADSAAHAADASSPSATDAAADDADAGAELPFTLSAGDYVFGLGPGSRFLTLDPQNRTLNLERFASTPPDPPRDRAQFDATISKDEAARAQDLFGLDDWAHFNSLSNQARLGDATEGDIWWVITIYYPNDMDGTILASKSTDPRAQDAVAYLEALFTTHAPPDASTP